MLQHTVIIYMHTTKHIDKAEEARRKENAFYERRGLQIRIVVKSAL
jgi:hypothetical protein